MRSPRRPEEFCLKKNDKNEIDMYLFFSSAWKGADCFLVAEEEEQERGVCLW